MPAALWTIRALWLVLPFTAGPALGAALAGASPPVRATASVGLWAGWAVTLVALLVPRTLSLTAARIAAPVPLVVLVGAALGGHGSAGGLGVAAAIVVVAMSAPVGESFVQGSAYGNERRFPLRPPLAVVVGPLVPSWAALVAGLATGPLLLAAGQWVAGAAATIAGAASVAAAGRALHSLARRWVLFVPAGLVLHDPYALDDPVLFPRRLVTALGPAEVGTDALDLTGAAPGLALELELRESVPMVLAPKGARRRARSGETGRVSRLLFTPTRPGRVLATFRGTRRP